MFWILALCAAKGISGGMNIGMQAGFMRADMRLKLNDDAKKLLDDHKGVIDDGLKLLDDVDSNQVKEGMRGLRKELPKDFIGISDEDINKISDKLKKYIEYFKDAVKEIRTGEIKSTSNNGFVGINCGGLKRFDKVGVGALVEANFAFGQNLKFSSEFYNQLVDVGHAKVFLRFNGAAYLRAVFFASDRVFLGGDFGLSVQEIRLSAGTDDSNAKTTGTSSTNKKSAASMLIWGPAVRGVVGVSLDEEGKWVATLTAGATIPIKQGSYENKIPVKPRVTIWQVGVGFSRYF